MNVYDPRAVLGTFQTPIETSPGYRNVRIPGKGPEKQVFLAGQREGDSSRRQRERRYRDSSPEKIDSGLVDTPYDAGKKFFLRPGFGQIIDAAAEKGEVHIGGLPVTDIEGFRNINLYVPPKPGQKRCGEYSDKAVSVCGIGFDKNYIKPRMLILGEKSDFFEAAGIPEYMNRKSSQVLSHANRLL